MKEVVSKVVVDLQWTSEKGLSGDLFWVHKGNYMSLILSR